MLAKAKKGTSLGFFLEGSPLVRVAFATVTDDDRVVWHEEAKSFHEKGGGTFAAGESGEKKCHKNGGGPDGCKLVPTFILFSLSTYFPLFLITFCHFFIEDMLLSSTDVLLFDENSI